MKEYKANTVDIDAKVTTISGEEVLLKPRTLISAKRCGDIMGAMSDIEKKYEEIPKEDRRLNDSLKMAADELELIYDKDTDWFLENLDVLILQEILKDAAGEIGNIVKK